MSLANSKFSLVCFILLAVASACSEVHEAPFEPDGSVGSDSALGADGATRDAFVLTRDGAGPLVSDARVPQDATVVQDASVDAKVLVDVCDNPDDLAGLAELSGDFNRILQDQGIPCFIASMGGAGFAMCIAAALSEYLSEDCALCVGQQADCLVSNCLDRCITDQGGDACLECVCNAGCVQNFTTCSGVDFGLFECPEP